MEALNCSSGRGTTGFRHSWIQLEISQIISVSGAPHSLLLQSYGLPAHSFATRKEPPLLLT